MRNLKDQFQNRKIDEEKLLKFGFSKKENQYLYQTYLTDDFIMNLTITKESQTSSVMDSDTLEEYILVDTLKEGSFSSEIKKLYENKIEEIINTCTISNMIDQTEMIIHYMKEKYQDNLEYLWKNDKNSAIWRHKENQKWYGILMKIEESKLGISSHKLVSIINLKYQKEFIDDIVDNATIFRGYHMNKKHWITIKLDGSIKLEELFQLIDNSYQLTR